MKGDGTMSAITQNYVYVFGQKKDNTNAHIISKERLEEIKKSVSKYQTKKEK